MPEPEKRSTSQAMQDTFEVNLYGVVRVTEAFLPLLKAAPYASIVNVSSGLGSINYWLGEPLAFLRGGKAIPYWYNIVLSSFLVLVVMQDIYALLAAIATHQSCARCSVSKTALNALTVHWADMLADTKIKVLLPCSMPIFHPTSKTRLSCLHWQPLCSLSTPSLASDTRLCL